eukprot:2185681-Rhodomonas_salina.1
MERTSRREGGEGRGMTQRSLSSNASNLRVSVSPSRRFGAMDEPGLVNLARHQVVHWQFQVPHSGVRPVVSCNPSRNPLPRSASNPPFSSASHGQ